MNLLFCCKYVGVVMAATLLVQFGLLYCGKLLPIDGEGILFLYTGWDTPEVSPF